jgi:hypothetical protein
VLDGILMERRGIPAAAICTEPFVANAQAIALAHGAGGYPFALIPHPLGSASAEELTRRARTVLPELLRLLLRA